MDRNAITWTGGTSNVSRFVICLGNSHFIFFFILNRLELYLNRCQYLCAALRVPLAADRPDVQDSRTVALIVCLVQMDRSATRLVVSYRLYLVIYLKGYTLNAEFLPMDPSVCLQRFHRVPKVSRVLLARQGQGEMLAWDWRVPVFLWKHGHHLSHPDSTGSHPDVHPHDHLSPFSLHTNCQGQQLRN